MSAFDDNPFAVSILLEERGALKLILSILLLYYICQHVSISC